MPPGSKTGRFDVECFEDRILELIKLKLPAKVAEINTEKNIGLTGDDIIDIEDIPADNYVDSLTEKIANMNTFVYYGVGPVQAIHNGGRTALKVNMILNIVFTNVNETLVSGTSQSKTRKQAFRYSRAFREIIEENFDWFSGATDIEVQEISPGDFYDNEQLSGTWKVAGVNIAANIG